ncbi:preprotein translocase subunit SecY [Candidatus Woesearchaeota archaeon]|nr:preprotein translocase subunit SecY [Candidatus Woesearchaeota archaeon]
MASLWNTIKENLPEVTSPTQKNLSFKEKLKWTSLVLSFYFVLGIIPLFGLGQNALTQFEYLSLILGAKFGTIISLGIGPIVTASIILQLLNGSGLIKFDLSSKAGKQNYGAIQKLSQYGFVLFEAIIYVFMGGFAPSPLYQGTALYFQLELLLIFQLLLGGLMIILMDEVCQKWGFGSGVSLFIAAGVSQQLFHRAFSWTASPTNPNISVGALPALFQSLAAGDPTTALLMGAGILSTIAIFAIVVYVQSMKVEIPLSFGRIRGHGIRWPLSFIYTSNIPVILIAAFMSTMQLWGRLLENWGYPILGTFSGNVPITGMVSWFNSPNLVQKLITRSLTFSDLSHSFVYILIMMFGSVVFSYFWVQTANMDAGSQAENIMKSGLQVPGFRKDKRVLEKLLDRYISPLTVMGAMIVGFLAAAADLSGALVSGTGLLLTVMIIYKLYESIAKTHMYDMHPALRKFME